MICWTFGITEHHNAVDNVVGADQSRAAHRPRRSLRLRMQSAARPEQRPGRRRHGRAAEQASRIPGRRRTPSIATKFERAWGRDIIPPRRLESHRDDRRDGYEGAHRALRHRRESRAVGRRRARTSTHVLEQLDHLVVQEIFLTKTAQLARRRAARGRDVGRRRRHRHEQRAPRAARVARRSIRRATRATRSGSWRELAQAARVRLGTSDCRRRVERGARALAAACRHDATRVSRRSTDCSGRVPTRSHPGTKFLHARLWDDDPSKRGRLAPFSVVHHEGPVEQPDDEYPFMLTTGRRLESYNTGVQIGRLSSRRCTVAKRSTCRPKTPARSASDTATSCG